MPNKNYQEQFGLPPKIFLYTLEQIAYMIEMDLETFKRTYIHYAERSVGARQHPLIEARNIAPDGEKPQWRVAENELIRWLRYKGFRIYHRGVMTR